MKFTHSKKHNAGIGLIEVLVATVVVAVGLLAVATLQGGLMGGSRDNKTRAECQSLANTKMEQLRDAITPAGYTAIVSSTANENITGVTETFSRGWTVTDQTSPNRKQVNVTVSWGDASAENQCIVQSVIAFDDVGNSLLAAGGGAVDGATSGFPIGGPSTNAESSDEITETIKLATPGTTGNLVEVNGKNYIVEDDVNKGSRAYACDDGSLSLTSFENDLYTRRMNHDGVSGNEAIELYEKKVVEGVNYCIPRIRFNGAVIIPIRGIVYSAASTGTGNNTTWLDVSLFTFNATESGTYCVFKPATGTRSAPYVCYIGGNCTGYSDSTKFSTDVTACPGAISAAKVGPGGWRGKVGLLGVAGASNNFKNACFAEELAGPPTTLDTARNYYTRNAANGNNEGINKPYSCHDFLIIDGQSTERQVHDECVKQANMIAGLILASKDIRRDINGNNIFDPIIDLSYCSGTAGTNYTITGPITGASTPPTVTITDGRTQTPSTCATVSTTLYTCTINSVTNSVTIAGIYNNQPVSCNLVINSSTTSPTGCALAFTPLPIYTMTGHITAANTTVANAVSLKVDDGVNSIACVNNNDFTASYSTYTCILSTSKTAGIKINATSTPGYTATPSSYSVPTLSGSTSDVTTGDFAATVTPVYAISGTISLGDNVDNLTSISIGVKIGTGSCTIPVPNGGWKERHNATQLDTYSCTVTGNVANSLSVTIAPTCSDTKSGGANAFKKYEISSTGATSTIGTGQLVIDLGTVTGNQTKNITIAESTTDC